MMLISSTLESPIGPLNLVADETALRFIVFARDWPQFKRRHPEIRDGNNQILAQTRQELREYFAGKRRKFTVPVKAEGTDFQRRAWDALLTIAFGATLSYQEQAARIGNPRAVRAIGLANAKNPLPIIVPCHRVIGKSGHLTGYSSGLEIKRRLLELEGHF